MYKCPVPRIEGTFDSLVDAKRFPTLDLDAASESTSGSFRAFELRYGKIPMTGTSTTDKSHEAFEFTVMRFG